MMSATAYMICGIWTNVCCVVFNILDSMHIAILSRDISMYMCAWQHHSVYQNCLFGAHSDREH